MSTDSIYGAVNLKTKYNEIVYSLHHLISYTDGSRIDIPVISFL